MNIFEFNEKLTLLKNTASALRGKTMVATPHGKGRVHGYVVIGYTLEAADNEILLFSEDGPYDCITLAQANSLLNGGMVDLGQYSVSLWDTDKFASEMAEIRERFASCCKALTGRVIRFTETMHDDANGENVEVHDTFIAEAIISQDTQPGEIPNSLDLAVNGHQ